MNQDDATAIILRWLREAPNEAAHYGYDLYVPDVIRAHLVAQDPRRRHEVEQEILGLTPVFYAAAWDLCRRGILRPGVRASGEQATPDGSAGNGYCVTPSGQEYLAQEPEVTTIPLGPGRFEQMMEPFAELLGAGFQERAGEAIRCYQARAFVACCAMTGAAAESLMLAVAIAKTGNENDVLTAYVGNLGRRRIENMIVGQAAEHIKREFGGFLVLLKYWRDQASHGIATQITDNEAYTALVTLLRFSHFARDHWAELTQR